MIRWWRRLRDWHITRGTLAAIAERECRHNGSDPLCTSCLRALSGW